MSVGGFMSGNRGDVRGSTLELAVFRHTGTRPTRKGKSILWEVEAIVDLRPGDLRFFFDAIVHQFDNRVVRGTRHSVVAFAQGNTMSWWTRECGWDDSREREFRAPRDKYRKARKMLQKETKLMSESNPKKEKCGWRQAKAEQQSRIQFKISQVIVCIHK
jgi:hypothetical protein